ncbi:MAG TPA: cell division topological specificity factor MinE [Peptococcaceae bacterium]|nr:cell division topological specificity factor MinE [Peptococcaceae bacterium]
MFWEMLFRVVGRDSSSSRFQAKERLRLVLVHDRAKISPYLMNRLKEDLISAISNYMVINEEAMEVHFNQDEREVVLVASIPIKKIKRDYLEKAQ